MKVLGCEILMKNSTYIYFKHPLDSVQDLKNTKHYIILSVDDIFITRLYKNNISKIKCTKDGVNWIKGYSRIK